MKKKYKKNKEAEKAANKLIKRINKLDMKKIMRNDLYKLRPSYNEYIPGGYIC